jgi:hypothetical protein
LVFASAIEYGAFSVRNFFLLYPLLPWCFLIGTLIGVGFGFGQKYAYKVREFCYKKCSEQTFESLDRTVFRYFSWFKNFSPSIFWAGA